MKAEPIIAGVRHWVEKNGLEDKKFQIIIPHPSQKVFNQSTAHTWSEYNHLLFICGRYEGIDDRVWLWLQKTYPENITRISL